MERSVIYCAQQAIKLKPRPGCFVPHNGQHSPFMAIDRTTGVRQLKIIMSQTAHPRIDGFSDGAKGNLR